MIQRVSDQNKIMGMEATEAMVPLRDRTPEMKSRQEKKPDRSWEKVTAASYLNGCVDEFGNMKRANSIFSAQTGGISDLGGPSQQIKTQSSNSIFDPHRSDKIAASKTSKESTLEEKESASKIRNDKEAQWKDAFSPKVGETNDSVSSVVSASLTEGSKGWVPSHKMSIFDSEDFQRLAAPEGEKITRRIAAKDDSWKNPKRAVSTTDLMSNMVDRLSDVVKDRNNNASFRQDSIDRLHMVLRKKAE